MRWFLNKSLRFKIIFSFVMVSIVTLIVGYVGWVGISDANKGSSEMSNQLHSVVKLALVRSSLLIASKSIDQALVTENDAKRMEYISSSSQFFRIGDDAWDAYKKSDLTEEEKFLAEEFEKAYKDYREEIKTLVNFVNRGEIKEAKIIMQGKVEESFEKWKMPLGKLFDLQKDISDKRFEIIAMSGDKNKLTMLIFSFLGMVISIALGYWISSIIGKPINRLVTNVKKLSRGDVNIESAQVNKTNDEIGMLEKSFGEMVENMKQQAEGAVKVSQGDLSVNIIAKSEKDILSNAMKKVIESLRNLSAEVDILTKAAIEGQLDKRGNSSKFEGAYKEIITGFNETLDAIVKPVQDSLKVIETMSTGDFTPRVTENYKGQHQLLKESVNKLGDSVVRILRDVIDAVQATATASNQISSSTEELAAGAQEQSAQSNEIAAAINQMTATITQTTKHASNAAENSKVSLELATEGNKSVQETVEGMKEIANVVNRTGTTIKELGKSSDQIGEIVQVIDDIADQTNLLALNAAIEAARAGEQGRGFAVVADEVRKLAERTTKATKEIAEMIKKIQKDTNEAVISMEDGVKEVERGKELAVRAGDSLQKIIISVQQVNDIITQVAAASEEQSATAEQISHNIESINNVTQESASGTQQIARAAEDLNRLTDNLQNLINKFNIGFVEKKNTTSKLTVRANGKLVEA
ncbi:methyl-accepting chemotaxis protein [Melioribacteraceae bacterium 4301-Me]|uniref:HAMP domain-containing methyl-accepting chemotaxis protein n=1 Tax=Pyranulibacter aquaticus TaxID=3163344 RepID=UPI003595419A